MKIRLFITIVLIITFSSCIDKMLGERYVQIIKTSQRTIEKWYEVDGLFNHFPKSVSSKSVVQMQYSIPGNMTDKEWNRYIADCYLILNAGDNDETLYPDSFLYKTDYKENNFIIDFAFKFYTQLDTLKVRNFALPNIYPIPYFESSDFGLGDVEEKYWYEPGVEMVSNKYNIPEDLEVFVFKAGHGDYWKVKCDIMRPETLGQWKNGYSSGVAISKNHNMIVYWMMAW